MCINAKPRAATPRAQNFLDGTDMRHIPQASDEHKATKEFLSDLYSPIPPDPLIEIVQQVKEGFDYARRCLLSINRLRKEISRLNRVINDLNGRQEYLENLVIQRGQN